jgi:hypothetical protein
MAKFNLTKILTESAGLVAGGVASNLVAKNVPIANEQVKKALPLLVGAYLSTMSNSMIRNAGYGMIAVQGTAIAKGFLPTLAGVGEDVMLAGDVMLSEDVLMGESGDPLMGNVPFGDDALSTQGAYDFTYAGEMQY